jgi:hypothetical protein
MVSSMVDHTSRSRAHKRIVEVSLAGAARKSKRWYGIVLYHTHTIHQNRYKPQTADVIF